MKIKLIYLAGFLAITSCSNSNDEIPTENKQELEIQNITKMSWTFPSLLESTNGKDPNYHFEYDSQGRLTKKIGGILKMPGSTGWGGSFFTNNVYTSITYNGNNAVTGNYFSDGSPNLQVNERSFNFDNQGRVVKAVLYFPSNPFWEKHLTYNYDTSGKLISIFTQVPNMPYFPTDPNDYILTYLEKFTYDTLGNLQKAVTTERHNNNDALVIKEIVFSNFDSRPNIFKKLWIIEDYFYYSLSKNNFQKRIIKEYNGVNTTTNQQEWTYQYDAEGNIKLFF
nr:hypothetical protein [uncultured Chryseobacterium sp.]